MVGKAELVDMTAGIVSAYVGNNSVNANELPILIQTTFDALAKAGSDGYAVNALAQEPAVEIAVSVTDDFIICLEDGKQFKSLKRHLRSQYNLSPDDYRVKWGLPHDYPMVAPSYAKARSRLAKEMGLGLTRGKKRS